MKIAGSKRTSDWFLRLRQGVCAGLVIVITSGCNKAEPPRGYGWFLERDGQGKVLLIPALHVARNNLRTLPPFVESSILASEALAIEYVGDASGELDGERVSSCFTSGRLAGSGSEVLAPATRDAVQRLLLDSGMPPPEHLHTVLDAQRLVGQAMLKVLGLRKEFGIDASLRAAASNFSKSLEPLEPECSAIRKMANVENFVNNAVVRETVEGITSGTFHRAWQGLEDSWVLGDETLGCSAVDQLLSSSAIDRRVFEVAVHGRNDDLAEGITRISSNGRPVVAALGLGHFCGPDSILAELARRGYRATFRKG
jgi:uncharacterized protein YbaP (TraB family)